MVCLIRTVGTVSSLACYAVPYSVLDMYKGFVVTLPLCDRSHRVLLDEQTLDVGPVSGETRDQGEVEIRCKITYRVIDPDCLYVSIMKSPRKFLTPLAQNSMITVLGHLPWSHLEDGGGKLDFSNEVVTSLNCNCGVHGLQIARVVCTSITLIRAPPSPETLRRSTLSTVQKQLQNLTSIFFPGKRRSDSSRTSADPESGDARVNVASKSVNEASVPEAVDSKDRSKSVDIPRSVKSDPVVETNANEEISRTQLMSLRLTDASATRAIVCSQVIARAQPFLNNDLVCRALDRATLQLVIGSEPFREPLPSPTEAACDETQFSVLYLDAKSGRAAMGALPDADVELFVTAADLHEILTGQLDLLKAVNEERAVVKGSSKTLDKLRHLLFLRSG
ncbi:unnamed protein product [Echinostoma caproni]|uniref:SCP2 domain-containing protein n=1 Tax=Echinostoma caproni TaxID=27848 RepID=A0A183AMF0_9TREM|nr:unnamed protein product [Echinostoma caproni]